MNIRHAYKWVFTFLAMGSGVASADIEVQELFDYPAGMELSQTTAMSGWSSGWMADGALSAVLGAGMDVTEGSLGNGVFGSRGLTVTGNRFEEDAQNGLSMWRGLSSPIEWSSNTVSYFSCLIRWSGNHKSGASRLQFEIGDGNSYFGLVGDDVTYDKMRLSVRNTTANTQTGSTLYDAGKTYMLVAKIETVASGNDSISVALFEPDQSLPDVEPVWDLTATTARSDSSSVFGLNSRLWLGGRTSSVDELRIGTSWKDVSALSSPASSKAFLDQMDLEQPKMSEVKAHYNAGAYDNALNVWRNILMADLRKTPMGEFSYHGIRTVSHMVTWADMLAGKITEAQYNDWLIANNRTYCTDVWGLSGAPGTLTRANWLAVPDKFNADQLSDFQCFIPLTSRYWQNQDATYAKKWFEISSDFSRNCYNDINPLSRDEKRASYPNLAWNTDAGSALMQASRVAIMFKSMALLSKSVPGGSKASDWMDSLAARSDIPTAGSYDVFPSIQVADTALSLVKEHSIALQERYLTAGAVPNQRFSGLYSLLLTSRYLDMFKSVQTTIKPNTEAAMLDFVTTTCYSDGGMLEQSLNYNEGDARRMEELLSIYNGVSAGGWKTSMDRAVDRFWQMEWALRGPTFSVPQIGNRRTDITPEVWTSSTVRQNWINSQLAKYEPKGTLEQQINSAYGGGQGPVFTSIAFPYSGYYLQRSGWTMDDMALFFMAGRPQRGHSMRDKNAIQVSAYGRDLLVASGYPTYGSNSSGYPAGVETYLGEQSSAKVNTILVDDKDQNRTDAQQVYTDPVNSMWHSSPYFDFVEGLHDKGYGSETDVSHQRQTVFVKEAGAWVVLDNLFSTDQSSHTYRQTWNFQPYYTPTSGTSVFGFKENEVIIDSVNKRIYTADNDTSDTPNVYLYSFGNNVSYDKYFGSTAPVYGWYARGYGDGIPAVDVHARFSGVGNQQLITLIKPTKGLSSGITSLTDAGSGAVKGFDGETGGVAIKVRGTVGSGVMLSAGGVNAQARTLVVTTVAGVVRGIAIGAETFSAGTVAVSGLGGLDFEFHVLADGNVDIQRILVPQDFQWVESGADIRPDYGIGSNEWVDMGLLHSGYLDWIGRYGLSGSPDADPNHDYDADSMDNFAEFALGGNPTLDDAASFKPRAEFVFDSGSHYMNYVYRRRSDYEARGLVYTVEACTNLIGNLWSTNDVLFAGSGRLDPSFDSVTNRVSAEGYSQRFIRLRFMAP